MNAALLESDRLVGDGLSLADIGLAPYARVIRQYEFDGLFFAGLEGTRRWFDRCRARPAWHAEVEALVPTEARERTRQFGADSIVHVERLLAG